MFSERPSPVKVTAEAAKKLPRWALIALLIAFIVPQLFSADLWNTRDTVTFGVIWSMVQGSASDWLLPNIAGTPVSSSGPLTAWLGALCISILGETINPVVAARLTAGIWFAITTASIWYGTYLLARRDEAQPVAFAFGGEAARKDYGRTVADIAVLLVVATFGLVMRLHEVAPPTTLLALASLCLFGTILSLEKVWQGSLIAGIAAGAAVATTTLGAGIWLTFAAWFATFCTPNYTSRTQRATIVLTSAAVCACIWPALAFLLCPQEATHWFALWLGSSWNNFGPLPLGDYLWLAKNFLWYTWPCWPFALWAIYAWRQSFTTAHITLPCAVIIIGLFSILFTNGSADNTLLALIPALSILASFGVISVRKNTENALDLFSGIIFTLALATIWAYFIAWNTGEPAKMAFSITRLAPEIQPGVAPALIICAIVATLIWLGFTLWRLFKHPRVAWRGAWLAASGLTCTWIVATSLFAPLITGARSNEPMALQLHTALLKNGAQDRCVQFNALSLAEKAAFYYWGKINFASQEEESQCRYMIRHIDAPYSDDVGTTVDGWKVLANVKGRPRSEYFYQLLEKLADTPLH